MTAVSVESRAAVRAPAGTGTRRRTTGAPPRRGGAIVALVPAGVMAVIGGYGIGTRDLWNDELVTAYTTRLSMGELRRLVGNIDLVHVAYYLLIKVWTALAGDSPPALRAPSVVAMATAAALIVLIGRRLADTAVGFVGGVLFVLLPAVSRYAQEARSYAFVTAGAALATWLLLRALERRTRLAWVLYGASLVVAGWLHFVVLMLLAAHALYVLATTGREDDRRWEWVIAAGAAMLPVIPLLVWGSRQSGQISWIRADIDAVGRFPGQLFGNWQVAALVAALGLLGLALALLERRRAAALLLVTWALVPPVVGYATFSWLHLFLARYYLFTLPAWCLLAAYGVCETGRTFSRRRRPALFLVGTVLAVPPLVILGLPAQREVRAPTLPGQPAYFVAVRYVQRTAEPGDGIAFNDEFGRSSDLARKVTDYVMRGSQRPRDVFLARPAAERGWLTATECADPAPCLGDTRRIWLLETGHLNDPFAGLPEERARLLRDTFRVVEVRAFDKIRVVLLERVDG